ncbi:MAG TPA: ATP-dependent helicase [Phycisphaerales bacterium]|nr:ATP-dependent helicase [Phycisphaerales bacterium]
MKLTDAQCDACAEIERHALVVACPGSGKTRTIIARLVRAIERVRCTPRRIACITYTNAAASEIESRLRQLLSGEDSEYCEVGTIHAFCLRSVLRVYASKIPGYERDFQIAPPTSDEFVECAEQAIADCGLGGSVRAQDFEQVRRGPKGQAFIPSSTALTEECVAAFWEIMRTRLLVDFPSITYLAYQVLRENPHLARTVSARFREIVIDEMQDTDSLQVALLTVLADAGRSRFFMVGDPEQSIYSFAGAEPRRMFEFAQYLDARSDFELLENWRSSAPITRLADAIRPRTQPMRAVGEASTETALPELVVASSSIAAVTGAFLPALHRMNIEVGRAAVLAPAWYLLFPIAKELRRLGVPVSGPGSRPYQRRGRLMTGLLENLCACMIECRPDLLRRVQFELFDLIQQTEGKACFDVWQRAGRLAVAEMMFSGRALRASHPGAIAWIEAASGRFAEIMEARGLIGAVGAERMRQAGEEITADIRSNRDVQPDQLTVDDLGTFANPDGSVKLLTFHAAKGREFDAVCVVELQEGQMPHPRGDLAESRRVLYVAVTRPHRFLMLASRLGATQCRFLRETAVRATLNVRP